MKNEMGLFKNVTNSDLYSDTVSESSFTNSLEDQTNKLRKKRNTKNVTSSSMNTNGSDNSNNDNEEIADSSYVNPVLERAPLPYTDLQADKIKPKTSKPADTATVHLRSETQDKVKRQKSAKDNSTDDIHPLPSKPKYVFAPVTPTHKKYKVIQRKPDSKFQESSPPHVIYSDESDDSLFDYIEDMRTKNTNLYPYKFPDFNFPNLNHASFNFDDSDEDNEALQGREEGVKKGKPAPLIIDAHDSHDMEHEYVASEEGLESEKREETQQPENDNDHEEKGGEGEEEAEEEENDDDYNEQNNGNKNKQEDEEEEDYTEKEGEHNSEEETDTEEEEEENKEDEGNEEDGRAKDYPNNHKHISAQIPEPTWRPSDFPMNYRPQHNSQLQSNVRDGYDIPVTRFPYSSTDDIKQSFISHPLAGPTASKGFNHDFTPLRGGKMKGPFGVEPPHKYPIVPLFNKDTLHKPLSTTIPAGPVSPINLSGFNGYKHFVAPLVSAEDQTPFNEYNNPRQSGSRYRATYRGGMPHGLQLKKAQRGNGPVRDEKVMEEENEAEKEDDFPLDGVKEDDGNLNYPDFDDFDLPPNPYILDNSSSTQATINHRLKPSFSTNNNPNSFNFLNFEGQNQHKSESSHQKFKPSMKEESLNYYQSPHNDHPDHYRKPKSTFDHHSQQSSAGSKNKNKFPTQDKNNQPGKPFIDNLQGDYMKTPVIQESGKYDYPHGSDENSYIAETNPHDGLSNPSNYRIKTKNEDYPFPKNIKYNNFHYPTTQPHHKSNHKDYDGLREATKYNKFENYPVVNDSSFESHSQNSPEPHPDFKSESVPYNFTSGLFGDLTEKQKYHNMKNNNPFDRLHNPSSDTDNGKESLPNGYKYPFSTNEHFQNAHYSTQRPSESYHGHYNVPPYESISNYRNKNLGDLSPTQASNEFEMFDDLNVKHKNHKPIKPIHKKRNKSKSKKKSQVKKNNSNSKMTTQKNRPKTNSKFFPTQKALNEDRIRNSDTIPNPSIPLRMFDNNRLKQDFTGPSDFDRSNVKPSTKTFNVDQTKNRLPPKKLIYDLHGLYHDKNHKASDKIDANNGMRSKLINNQDRRNIIGTRGTTSTTNPAKFHYDSPILKYNVGPREKQQPTGYSYDEELDEPSTEAPEVGFLRKLSGKSTGDEESKAKSLSRKELVNTLNKILDKKDAISRDKNIDENGDKLKKYSNYWVLEYSMPTE